MNLLFDRLQAHPFFKILWSSANYELTTGAGTCITSSEDRIFGIIEAPDSLLQPGVDFVYQGIFDSIQLKPGFQPVRIWNFIPDILSFSPGASVNNYELFNSYRKNNFTSRGLTSYPAASAVGTKQTKFYALFFASTAPVDFMENYRQTPAANYSAKYGMDAPLFSRGALWGTGAKQNLMLSGTASVEGEDSVGSTAYEQLNNSLNNIRVLACHKNMREYGFRHGYALEDAGYLHVYHKNESDLPFIKHYLERMLPTGIHCSFSQNDICRAELLVEIEGIIRQKVHLSPEQKYVVSPDNRVQTESIEFHVAENCNLKCEECCNLSPYMPQKYLDENTFKEQLDWVKKHLKPEIIKLSGGEPTLHPRLAQLCKIAKASGAARKVRIISNGLRIKTMSEDVWENIDQLWISNYVSAPVKPDLIKYIKAKAEEHAVVLNIKTVLDFNRISGAGTEISQEKNQQIYESCWMKHRCHIIRNNRFYICTKAAYMDDFVLMTEHQKALTYTETDSLPLEGNSLSKILNMLHRHTAIRSCERCLGTGGDLFPNRQLSKDEVKLLAPEIG